MKVGEIDEIDLYECLHREPEAVHFFYDADEKMKRAFVYKNIEEGVKSLDELVKFIVEMALEDYPHSRTHVCKAIDNGSSNFEHLKEVA